MDWRFLEWLMGLGVIALTFLELQRLGGTPWRRHFGPVFLLALLAIPWPTRVESWVVSTLTGLVSGAAAELLQWYGVAAWRSGSLIYLPNGPVGMDETCSGIRSLQGTLMAAGFFSLLHRLSLGRAAGLFAAGLTAAVFLNIARTFALSLAAVQNGGAGVEAWHDPAGLAVLLASFFLLWALAKKLARPAAEPVPCPAPAGAIRLRYAIALCAWLISVEAMTELWFRVREPRPPGRFLAASVTGPGWTAKELPARTRSILRCDEASFWKHRGPGGIQSWFYHLKWREGSPGTPLARYHSPEICLPAAGLELIAARPGPSVRTSAGEQPFRAYEFNWMGRRLDVLFLFREAGMAGEAAAAPSQFDLTWGNRLERAWDGRRASASEIAEIALLGASSAGEAERTARELLEEIFSTGSAQ